MPMKLWFAALLLAACTSMADAREIALSFDDAPRSDTPMMTGTARAQKLIAALKAAGVEDTIFLAVPQGLPPDVADRLRAYAAADHLIANHSNTHPSLNELASGAYLADVAVADKLLRTCRAFAPGTAFP